RMECSADLKNIKSEPVSWPRGHIAAVRIRPARPARRTERRIRQSPYPSREDQVGRRPNHHGLAKKVLSFRGPRRIRKTADPQNTPMLRVRYGSMPKPLHVCPYHQFGFERSDLGPLERE